MAEEMLHVTAALAERRNDDVEDAQPIEEILAERPLLDGPIEITIGRRDDADVERPVVVATDGAVAALLEDPEECRLSRQRQLAELVE
jgi:hypothetical protein